MRRFTVKENHIGLAGSEILCYTHTQTSCYFLKRIIVNYLKYIDVFNLPVGIDTGDLSVILRLNGPVRGLLGLPGGKKLSN